MPIDGWLASIALCNIILFVLVCIINGYYNTNRSGLQFTFIVILVVLGIETCAAIPAGYGLTAETTIIPLQMMLCLITTMSILFLTVMTATRQALQNTDPRPPRPRDWDEYLDQVQAADRRSALERRAHVTHKDTPPRG